MMQAMSATSASRQQILAITGCALLLSLACVFLSYQVNFVEHSLFGRIRDGFAILFSAPASAHPSTWSKIGEIFKASYHEIILFLFSSAAIAAGYMLSKTGKIVTTFQLSVLGILCQKACWQLFDLPGQPIGLVICVIGGTVSGALARAFLDERKM
jgi:hypothetical protein